MGTTGKTFDVSPQVPIGSLYPPPPPPRGVTLAYYPTLTFCARSYLKLSFASLTA